MAFSLRLKSLWLSGKNRVRFFTQQKLFFRDSKETSVFGWGGERRCAPWEFQSYQALAVRPWPNVLISLSLHLLICPVDKPASR